MGRAREVLPLVSVAFFSAGSARRLYTHAAVSGQKRSSTEDPTIAHPGMALAETEDPTIAHPGTALAETATPIMTCEGESEQKCWWERKEDERERKAAAHKQRLALRAEKGEGERKAAAKQGQRARAGADKRPWERKGESESDLDCKAAKKQRTADIVRRCQKLISDIRVLRERGKHDERDIKATAQELISIYQDTITLAQS